MTETQLDQFCDSFKSEAQLRIALIALLELLPGVTGVRHTHGVSERGKDIVFTFMGEFETPELIACVVKNSPISGSADSNDGARTVYHQAEQALDTPLLNSDGEEERVSRCWIVTPYECTQSSLESIKGKLARKDEAVKFLHGRKLYELFERYYPDYLLFHSGLLGSYIADLETGLAQDNAVTNLLLSHGLSGHTREISRVYVEPVLELNVSKLFLTPDWPDPSILSSAVTRDQAVGLGVKFALLGEFCGAIAAPDVGGQIRERMKRIDKKICSAWSAAYKARRNADPFEPRELKRSSEAVVVLDHSSVLIQECLADSQMAKEQFDHFVSQLERANRFTDVRMDGFTDVLTNEERFDYSYVKGVAAQLPFFFEESANSCRIAIPGVDLIESGEDVLITAPAGFGKTTFCRWNVLNDLKHLRDSGSDVIPVMIPLHQLSFGPETTAETTLIGPQALQKAWADRRAASKLIRRFRFYLDGLDEVPDRTNQHRIVQFVSDLKKIEPSAQFILTGREHIGGLREANFLRIRVAEMNDAQLNNLYDRWFNNDSERKGRFKKQIEQIPAMKQVMRAPLLATLVLAVYETTSTLPESRIRLYEMFVSLMAGGWDAAKRVNRDTKFGSNPKIMVLQYLAGRLHLAEKRDATKSEFNRAVEMQLPGLQERASELLEEIVQDGLLVPLGTSYAFSHTSFQEFLAAKDLIEPKGRRAAEALARYLRGSDWWKEVMGFYIALVGQPKEIEEFIKTESLRIARTHFDRQMLPRTQALLGEITKAYPGAKPNFKFPNWPKIAHSGTGNI